MGDSEGAPLQIGDRIMLYDQIARGYLCADGFKSMALQCSPDPRDASCVFEITCKQSYQQLKSYKKILNNIGIRTPEELEHFKKEEDVDPEEEAELQRLGGAGGKLEKEKVDNEEEVMRQRGTVLKYGNPIQLKHCMSGKYVTLSKEAGLQPGSYRLEVTDEGGEGSWTDIMPGFKVRKEGDAVTVTDQALFKMSKKSTPDRPVYIHTNKEPQDQRAFALKSGDGSARFPIPRGRSCTLGKAGEIEIVSSDVAGGRWVSDKHATLSSDAAGLVLRDADSEYGTFVNGVRIKEQVLSAGDVCVFGCEGGAGIGYGSALKQTPPAALSFTVELEPEEDSDIFPGCFEVNVFDQEMCRFTIQLYAKYDQGGDVLCSGDIVRLQHKEENGFFVYGPVWSGDGDTDKRRIHILSANKNQELAKRCSNALWEVEQVDVKSIDELTDRAQKGEPAEPKELGGNGRWESLYRLKHKGADEYMAASFDSNASIDPSHPRGPVRIYFTALRKKDMPAGSFREAHLETLWAIRPVNPKEDMQVPIGLSEAFHLQHAATCYWIHAKTAEGSDLGKYYDDPKPPPVLRTQRMIEMVAEKPYEDALGFEPTPRADVLDMNKALKIKPHLQKYADDLASTFSAAAAEDPQAAPHPRKTYSQVRGVETLLKDLIGGPGPGFLIPESKDLDPLTRKTEGELSATQQRRQQLLREQGFLDILVQMSSGASKGLPYGNLQRDEPNVFNICQLSNAVVEHIVTKNTENCLHMTKHIRKFIEQIGNKIKETDVLLALHENNQELLTSPETLDSFADWIQVMERAVDEESTDNDSITNRLELAVSFLSVTCVYASQQGETAIKRNQNHILGLLFDNERVKHKCVAHFEGSKKSIVVRSPLKSDLNRTIDLEALFAPEIDKGRKRNPKNIAVQDFVVDSIKLYANLCADRNTTAINRLREQFPHELVLDVIMTERPRHCDRLRAAFCDLFVRLYVDCDTYPADEDPIQLTRVWDEIHEDKVDRVSDLDEEPFVALKAWMVLFLSDELSEEKGVDADKCCTQMKSGPNHMGRNTFILAVVKMVYKMVQLRCFFQMSSLKDVLRPLFKILNGNTDRLEVDDTEPEKQKLMDKQNYGQKWRFKDTAGNLLLTQTKMWICKIIDTVSSIRMNVRISKMLLMYKNAYLSTKNGEKYVRAGSKFRNKTGLDKETRNIFQILDFESMLDMDGKLVHFLLDLVVYQDKSLVSESFAILLRQHRQLIECADKLSQVQLLCSKPQKNFLSKGKIFKKQLIKFKVSNREDDAQNHLLKTMEEMILTISLQEKDGDVMVDSEVCQGRQELYKNIGVPDILLEILRPANNEGSAVQLRVNLCKAIFTFLTLVCTGRDDTKERLKHTGFVYFLDYLKPEWTGVGADKLITELFNDNRTLCTQITAEDIKKFVALIVTHSRSPRWLGFMNSLVVVRELPIKKNQTLVIKELVNNKTKTMLKDGDDDPSLYVDQENWDQYAIPLMQPYVTVIEVAKRPTVPEFRIAEELAEGLCYHVELVNLLCKCAQGKNRAAEELCQQELPQDAILPGLKDPQTIPYVKRAYLDFLWESYVEVERPDRKTQFDPEIWQAMERMADELAECIDLQLDLGNFLPPYGSKLTMVDTDAVMNLIVEATAPMGSAEHDIQAVRTRILEDIQRDVDECDAVKLLGSDAIPYEQFLKLLREKAMKHGVNPEDIQKAEQRRVKLTDTKKRDQIQYLYSSVVKFLDGWFGDIDAGTSYYEPETWGAFGVIGKEKEKIADIATRLLDGVCQLNDSTLDTPLAECEVTTQQKEKVNICVLRMMNRGVRPSPMFEKTAQKLKEKGRELLENVDMYPPSHPPLTNEALTQKGLDMFSRDFKNLVNKEEEMKALVDLMRTLIITGDTRLQPYGDNKGDDYEPDRYVQIAVQEAESDACSAANKAELLRFLRLMIDLPGFPKIKGKSEDDEERRDQVRVRFCQPNIAVPELVISMGSRKGQNEVFKAVLLLAIALVGSGHELVQRRMLQILTDKIDEYAEPFFEELENRIINAKNECKTSRNFYKQQKDQDIAMQELEELEQQGFANSVRDTAKEILRLTAPPPERFEETGYIREIMKFVQQLCENDNQDFKNFIHLQEFQAARAPKSHDLVKAAVAYLEVWERNKDENNIDYGIYVFDMLTEAVIGPCEANQKMLGEELKMECINGLLLAEPPTEGGAPSREIQQSYVSLKQSCVLLLQSMLEAQKKGPGPEGRVLKRFEDLDLASLREEVIKLYQMMKDADNWHYRMKVLLRPILPQKYTAEPVDQELVRYAFQLVTLLRRIHDPLDNPKQRTPFIDFMLQGYEVEEGVKAPKLQIQKDRLANATTAFQHFINRMGRIEISRENDKNETRLERVYFEVPDRCALLTKTSKDDLINHIDRTSREDKLKSFVEDKAEDLGYEMILQSYNNNLPFYKFLDTYREFWKAFSFYLAIFINLILILGVDHEDKYDADPSAELDAGFGSTPYNIMDLYSLPVRVWGEIAVCEGISGCDKVAYIPVKMQLAIKYLGFTQTFTSTINWLIFIVGFGPVKVRMKWKNKHNKEQLEMKLRDPTYDPVGFDYMEYGNGIFGPTGKLWFYFRSFVFIITDGEVLYKCLYIAFTILGNFVSEFFFAFHLIDLLSRDQELMSVLEAITRPLGTIMKTLGLSMIVMYIFTVIGFVIFHDHFNPGAVKHDNLCNSMLQCFLFTLYSGIISSEIWAEMGISDLWPRHKYGTTHDPENNMMVMFVGRVIYDIFFFLLIGVVLIGGVLFGIILDNFSDIREEKANTTRQQREECFICTIGRDVFDKDGAGFNTHVADADGDHNMWQYLYFIIYLQDVDQADCNGPESYVKNKLAKGDGDVKWMPREAMVLEGQEEGHSDVEEELKKQVEQLQRELANIKRENKLANDTVSDLLKTLKSMEQSVQQV